MAGRRWLPDDDRTLRRLSPTRTAKQIARALGRTSNAVHQRAHLLHIPLQKAGDRDYRTKYPDTVVERARALHEAGLTPSEITRATGVPIGSVKSFIYYRGRHAASLALLQEHRHG